MTATSLDVVSTWWRAETAGPGITRLWEPHVAPLLRCNVWHVQGRDVDLLVDAGLGLASLVEAFPELFRRTPIVVATHSHDDHAGGLGEFPDRWGHEAEAPSFARAADERPPSLSGTAIDSSEKQYLRSVGYAVPDVMIDALPRAGFDPADYRLGSTPLTALIGEGDCVDLGDRRFSVLHLPGHTPGSIGLLDRESGVLFSGDAIYDGPLLDGLQESDVPAYIDSMDRLASLSVTAVHAGHDHSFGQERLRALTQAYLIRRREHASPGHASDGPKTAPREDPT